MQRSQPSTIYFPRPSFLRRKLSPQSSNHSISINQVKLSAATTAQEQATKDATAAEEAAQAAAASHAAAEAAEAKAKQEAEEAAQDEAKANDAAAEATAKADAAKESEDKGSRIPLPLVSHCLFCVLWRVDPRFDRYRFCSPQHPQPKVLPIKPLMQLRLQRQAMFIKR